MLPLYCVIDDFFRLNISSLCSIGDRQPANIEGKCHFIEYSHCYKNVYSAHIFSSPFHIKLISCSSISFLAVAKVIEFVASCYYYSLVWLSLTWLLVCRLRKVFQKPISIIISFPKIFLRSRLSFILCFVRDGTVQDIALILALLHVFPTFHIDYCINMDCDAQ